MILFESKRLAKDHGTSMTQLAEMLGIEPDSVQSWNRGESVPRVARLIAICEGLNISWAELGKYIKNNGRTIE